MSGDNTPRSLRRIIRLRDSKPYTGAEPSYAPHLIEEGKLPPLRQLTDGGRAVGWFEDDLIDYQDQIAERPVLTKLPSKTERVRLRPGPQVRLPREIKAANG